jgi:bifunctional DNA-binding transcriptional regulator/antitoxin component of YhaV-PrlF toxin-antitoxin module
MSMLVRRSIAAVITVRKARVTSKGQITVPKPVREQLGIQPGAEPAF